MSISQEKNKQKFTNYLENSNFSEVLFENDANEAYNRFHTIMQSAFDHSFPLTRLPRARAKDKVWITTALRKSSKKKSKLYKKWLQDETKLSMNNTNEYFEKWPWRLWLNRCTTKKKLKPEQILSKNFL